MMDERERRNIMTRAIQHFGETAQIDMAVENVVEEIADVQIMLDQLRLIFARSTDEVEEDKLRRLLAGSIAGRSRSSGAGCASRSARQQTRRCA